MSDHGKDVDLIGRIRTFDGSLPLMTTVAVLAIQLTGDVPQSWQYQIRRRGIRRAGVDHDRWLWPANLILKALTAIRAPRMASLADLQEFLSSALLVERLMEGKTTSFLREKLGLLDDLPHGLIAMAYLSGHERAVGAPSNSDGPIKMSRVELALAWHILELTRVAAEEIRVALENVGVGLCHHCAGLILKDRQRYCSVRCRRAYHNAQTYTRRTRKTAN